MVFTRISMRFSWQTVSFREGIWNEAFDYWRISEKPTLWGEVACSERWLIAMQYGHCKAYIEWRCKPCKTALNALLQMCITYDIYTYIHVNYPGYLGYLYMYIQELGSPSHTVMEWWMHPEGIEILPCTMVMCSWCVVALHIVAVGGNTLPRNFKNICKRALCTNNFDTQHFPNDLVYYTINNHGIHADSRKKSLSWATARVAKVRGPRKDPTSKPSGLSMEEPQCHRGMKLIYSHFYPPWN